MRDSDFYNVAQVEVLTFSSPSHPLEMAKRYRIDMKVSMHPNKPNVKQCKSTQIDGKVGPEQASGPTRQNEAETRQVKQ